MATNFVIYSETKAFGGRVCRCRHTSQALGGLEAQFSVFLPPNPVSLPQVYWLSGLTCTDENFITKASALAKASELRLAIVAPDTSPRGANVPGEKESWDFGEGAGFYVNATEDPWVKNYRMYDYVLKELPQVVASNFPMDPNRVSIMGHSMGGHGALILALKNPDTYKCVSAFAPICNPSKCPWGVKAFSRYLGGNTWNAYDACELLKTYDGPSLHILVDQGDADGFLVKDPNQLLPENLIAVCKDRGIDLEYRLRPGYDHSYFYISTFINEHLEHHAKYLT